MANRGERIKIAIALIRRRFSAYRVHSSECRRWCRSVAMVGILLSRRCGVRRIDRRRCRGDHRRVTNRYGASMRAVWYEYCSASLGVIIFSIRRYDDTCRRRMSGASREARR